MDVDLSQHERKDKLHSFSERLQDVFIILSLILGLRGRPEPGSDEEKRVPAWILANLDFLTNEDEILYNQAKDSYPDSRILDIEDEFRESLVLDGYAENKYRSLLAGMRQEFLDQVRKPAPENKSAGLAFGQLTIKDSCVGFFDQLIQAADGGENPEETYSRQKKAAEGRKLLVKKSILQKIREHPWRYLFNTVCMTILMLYLAFWVFGKLTSWIIGG